MLKEERMEALSVAKTSSVFGSCAVLKTLRKTFFWVSLGLCMTLCAVIYLCSNKECCDQIKCRFKDGLKNFFVNTEIPKQKKKVRIVRER